MTEQDPARGTVAFVFETGMLKRMSRTGWWHVGVKEPESIADHSFRAGIIGSILAMMEGADPARTALLSLFHDTQESRIGDIAHIGKRYLKAQPNEAITADQLAGAYPAVRDGIQKIVEEYESCTSIEAKCAHDADKVDCLVQAVEYREAGHRNIQPWIDTSYEHLRTESGRVLADAALEMTSMEWRETFLP
ncbi:HAD family hydrolase [Mangrovactinospora gilvigrisea]|uniref:5'-deoxynucleotidase n=1 Tax=Mangrovactinospora gilvigrisea TaxID=1428644 RepID=A0A1J7BFD0_9ACTN|nr:HD domain-containing protein [Mangrovactinospora gilvigrisea]OIV37387.1 HAD family hydrolase [Mangrovactinospora gilvigrisea]